MGAAVLILFLFSAVSAGELPQGKGKCLVERKCQACHGLKNLIESKGISRKEWEDVVEEMKDYGLEVTEKEEKEIVDYLSKYLGPEKERAGSSNPR